MFYVLLLRQLMCRTVPLLIAGVCACSCTVIGSNIAAKQQIAGSITFAEDMFLTPEARVEIRLLDVSRADATATEIAALTLDDPGPRPIEFTLDYNPADIREPMSYSVRAEVYDRGRSMFTTDRSYPVLTRGFPASVEMTLIPSSSNPIVRPDADFTETYWKLIAVKDEYVRTGDNHREAHIRFRDSGTVQGYGGCNNFSGGYKLEDGELSMGNLAMTMMACADTMGSEYAYTSALAEVTGYRIEGDTLALLAGNAILLRFEAVYF